MSSFAMRMSEKEALCMYLDAMMESCTKASIALESAIAMLGTDDPPSEMPKEMRQMRAALLHFVIQLMAASQNVSVFFNISKAMAEGQAEGKDTLAILSDDNTYSVSQVDVIYWNDTKVFIRCPYRSCGNVHCHTYKSYAAILEQPPCSRGPAYRSSVRNLAKWGTRSTNREAYSKMCVLGSIHG
ncbi:uncharacterized protein BDZ99DRAFT_297942 [Mytilinidion resinicola]|uniref:Uncharacterized protein n=1 Tax=Mytilinidion resinicola TaxID=574789 RepID=A0A6A6YTB8_9PEZI|nr:uncharacterized protein BDZ99DRAFT_297942 [Mytilinidion resinicola]KAF2811205.1 hypothetical protein BDZ99DRAFT_297942 [Mytilinidion resinicola]